MSKGQEPAFPNIYKNIDGSLDCQGGISTRLYLAGMAMQGLMVQSIPGNHNCNEPRLNAERVKFALDMADELIKQEEESR
jgi:hypothetical protein